MQNEACKVITNEKKATEYQKNTDENHEKTVTFCLHLIAY